MKRLIACVSLAAVATTATAASATTHQSGSTHHPAAKPASHAKATARRSAPHKVIARRQICKVAPADEYFGKLKMSILGIRNTIKDQGLKVDVDPGKASSTMGAMALTEDAMHDWQRKYPCDSWIPGTIYALEHFYAKVHTPEGVAHVHATYAWLHKDFPRNRFIAMAMKENGEASVTPPAAQTAQEALPSVPSAGLPAVPAAVMAQPVPAASPGPTKY